MKIKIFPQVWYVHEYNTKPTTSTNDMMRSFYTGGTVALFLRGLFSSFSLYSLLSVLF